MPTEQDGRIITEGAHAGWIRCDACRQEFGLLPTPEEIAESHSDGQGYSPPDVLTHQGCSNVATPDGCLVKINRDEVFAYYRKLGERAAHVHDAREDAPSGRPVFRGG